MPYSGLETAKRALTENAKLLPGDTKRMTRDEHVMVNINQALCKIVESLQQLEGQVSNLDQRA